MLAGFIILFAVIAVVLVSSAQASGSVVAAPSGGSTPIVPPVTPPVLSSDTPQAGQSILGEIINEIPIEVSTVLKPANTTPTGMESDTIDPYDQSTWPCNDLTDNVVAGIAIAEGFGANPPSAGTSRHNPGDISDNGNAVTGGVRYPQSLHSGSQIVDYGTNTAGWNMCRNKVARIVNGASTMGANKNTTWVGLANVWVGDATRRAGWAAAVTNYLQVSPYDTIGNYFGV